MVWGLPKHPLASRDVVMGSVSGVAFLRSLSSSGKMSSMCSRGCIIPSVGQIPIYVCMYICVYTYKGTVRCGWCRGF